MQSINLRHSTFNQALQFAKMLSGLTNSEIAEKSGLSPANVAKYFKPNEDYYPNPCNIPALCCALGNTVLLDWQTAQIAEICPQAAISSATDLSDAAMSVADRVGQLCAVTREHVADGKIDRNEAKESQAQIADMVRHLKGLHDKLEPLASGELIDMGRGQ